MSYRDYLGKFLRAASEALNKRGASFSGEVANDWGRPDYEVTIAGALGAVGYVEAESVNADLSRLTGHAKHQNERFKQNLHNFLLTNHYDFRLFVDGTEVERATLPAAPERGQITVPDQSISDMERLLERFLTEAAPVAASPEAIARQLAKRARLLRVAADEMLVGADSPLHSLWQSYQEALHIEMDAPTFADVYAQTFTYGLFLAWFSFSGATFDRNAAMNALPRAVPPIRALLRYGNAEMPDGLLWIVDGICADLFRAVKDAALKPFRGDTRDPMVYFYETFLAAYDPKLRESRGSYYTPDAVVDFIVRAVDSVLRRDFGKSEGLADLSVRLLDPAAGTGTFLARAYAQVREQMEKSGDGGLWPDRARNHLAQHFYGFELLPTAYTLAHLKLRQVLAEEGAPLLDTERLPVYLTNTLDDDVPPQQTLLLAKELSDEVRAADKVKKQEQILVVMGNPPYFGKSANPSGYEEIINPGETYFADTPTGLVERVNHFGRPIKNKKLNFIGKLLRDYYQVNGAGLGEKNPKWLQNDYVKFMRFAQWMIEKNGSGMVAFVTDNSYLDAPTFRGMRLSLRKSFDEIYLYDLHGNSKKKERAPNGSTDQNVFDIMQGVCIAVLIRRPGAPGERAAVVRHADLWGIRKEKEIVLNGASLGSVAWEELPLNPPFYLFVPQAQAVREEYERGWSVKDIFPVNSLGIVTARDNLSVHFTANDIWATVENFVSLPIERAREKYQLGPDARDWKVDLAQRDLKASGPNEAKILPVSYRPFDNRYTYYTGNSRGFHCMPRNEVMQHFKSDENLGLCVGRNVETNDAWAHAFLTRYIAGHHVVSLKEVNYVLPLYIYPTKTDLFTDPDAERRPNLSPAFLDALRAAITNPAETNTETEPTPEPTPEAIFHYLYAVLHAPSYRARYAEFLKRDFPRIPLPPSRAVFEQAAEIGAKLTAVHLLEAPELNAHGIGFPSAGDHVVEKMRGQNRYEAAFGRVYLNTAEYFENVPQAAWEFRVGGYQPAAKWLDDRNGRTLTEADIRHYRRLLAALRETVALLPDADAVFEQINYANEAIKGDAKRGGV